MSRLRKLWLAPRRPSWGHLHRRAGLRVHRVRDLWNGFTTNRSTSSVLTLTGFHGVHVTVGILMLITTIMIVNTGLHHVREAPMRSRSIGLYWHFVDVVWIVIFTVVYLINRAARYDGKELSGLFYGGAILAVIVYVAVLSTFSFWTDSGNQNFTSPPPIQTTVPLEDPAAPGG
jgi:hypothetical protein